MLRCALPQRTCLKCIAQRPLVKYENECDNDSRGRVDALAVVDQLRELRAPGTVSADSLDEVVPIRLDIRRGGTAHFDRGLSHGDVDRVQVPAPRCVVPSLSGARQDAPVRYVRIALAVPQVE